MRVERVSPQNERAALEYLARRPYENVFVSYLILFDLSPATRSRIAVAFDGDRVCGAGFFGRQIALAADDDALDALADFGRRHRGERMIVGPRATVAAYWERVRPWHQRPRVVRARQLVMAVDRRRLRESAFPKVDVRHARRDEWPAVADTSARMIRQELEYDPRSASADFEANVRGMIDRDLWWVGESEGRLCFFCNIGPWCRTTAQLQGIWTPPELRGQGLATAALGAICARLLEHSPTLSLYVNDFNAPAIALYERAGFETVGEFQTLLF